MSNTNQIIPVVLDDEVEEDFSDLLFENSQKQDWMETFAAIYGEQSIRRIRGGFVEFFVDLPVEFIENKLLQKWGFDLGSKLIIRFTPTLKVLHLSKNGTLKKFSVRTQVESMIEAVITMLTKSAPEVEKEPDPDLVIVLAEMGFDPELASSALIEVENDLEKAIEVFDVVASKIRAINTAKQNYSYQGLYAAIREYIIERLPYMTSFCAICDGVHIDNPTNVNQSSVCSRQLCTFRFKSMQLLAPDYYYVPTKVNNVPNEDIISIAAGSNHSVFCTSDGAVYSWGKGTAGQLGNGYDDDKQTPACIDALVKFVQVAAGEQHTVGLSAQKELYVWGSGHEALGFGTPVKYTTPQKLYVSECIQHISVVGNQNFALSEEGTLWVWGNILGQVFPTPTKLKFRRAQFATVRASLRAPTAVDRKGNVWLWTEYAKGFEKINFIVSKRLAKKTPIFITDAAIYDATLIAIDNHGTTLYVKLIDIVRMNGALSVPVTEVHQETRLVESMIIGNTYAAFITANKSVRIKGHGKAVLGLGEGTVSSPKWSKLYLPSAAQLVAGPTHALCLTIENEIYVWGRNHGTAGFAINSANNNYDGDDVEVPETLTSPIVFEEVHDDPNESTPDNNTTSRTTGTSMRLLHPGPLRLKSTPVEVPLPTYPPIKEELPLVPQLNARNQHLAAKSKETANRLRCSPYYVHPPKVKREVEKFSDPILHQHTKPKVYNLLENHRDSFPSELVSNLPKKVDGSTLLAHTLRTLDEFEKKEAAYQEANKNNKNNNNEVKENEIDEDEVMANEDDYDEFHDYYVNQFDDDEGMDSEPEENNEPLMD